MNNDKDVFEEVGKIMRGFLLCTLCVLVSMTIVYMLGSGVGEQMDKSMICALLTIANVGLLNYFKK